MFTAVTKPYRGQCVTQVQYVMFSKIVFYEAAFIYNIFIYCLFSQTSVLHHPHFAPIKVLWTKIRCCTLIRYIAAFDIPSQTAVNQGWRYRGSTVCGFRVLHWKGVSELLTIVLLRTSNRIFNRNLFGTLRFRDEFCVETYSKYPIYIQIFISLCQEQAKSSFFMSFTSRVWLDDSVQTECLFIQLNWKNLLVN